MPNQRKLLLGTSLLIVASLCWGGMFPIAKSTLAIMDGFYMTTIRYGITALIFLAILAFVEGPSAANPGARGVKAFLYGSAGFAGFSLLAFVGLAHSRPDHAAIIMALQTPMAAFGAWWRRGQRPAGFTLVCIVAVFAGALLTISKGSPATLLDSGTGFGDLLIFLGAVCWVVYTFGAPGFPGWSPLRYTALTCALGMISVFGLTALATCAGYLHMPTAADLAAVQWRMAYLIVFASVIAVLAWNSGIRLTGPLNGTLTANLVPVTVFAIAAMQGQRFTAAEIGGALLVVGALAANNLYLRRVVARAQGSQRTRQA